MKILVVTSYYKPAYVYGGPTRSISLLCEAMAKRGADITVLTTNANGPSVLDVPVGKPMSVDGVRVFYFPVFRATGSFFYSPSLARAIFSSVPRCDIVTCEALWEFALLPTMVACRRHRKPYVMPLRGQLMDWALEQKSWKKKVSLFLAGDHSLKRAAALHCTDPAEEHAVAALGIATPTFVVPNGLDLSTIAVPVGGRYDLKVRMGLPRDARVLLFLGRLKRIKRADIAVDVLHAVKKICSQAHLVIAGPDEDNLTPELKAQATSLGCSESVHFAGLVEKADVLSLLAETDLLLVPTEVQENFSMSTLEALSVGVPVLVSRGIPVGYWAEKAGAGRIAGATSTEFVEAALQLFAEPETLKAMGEQGRRVVQENFDIDKVAGQMLAHYEAIVATGRPLRETGALHGL